MKNIIKYIMIFSIFLIVISSIFLIFDSISIEEQKQKEFEDSNEIQKIRGIILEVNNDTAKLNGGKEYKLSNGAKNKILLKKWSDIYINASSNEIVRIEWQEHQR